MDTHRKIGERGKFGRKIWTPIEKLEKNWTPIEKLEKKLEEKLDTQEKIGHP